MEEPIVLEEPSVEDPRNCTKKCTAAFNATLHDHCADLPNEADEVKCVFKAFATWALCLEDCGNQTSTDQLELGLLFLKLLQKL